VAVKISGGLVTSAGTLFPGVDGKRIPVTLTNPNDVTIYITQVTVSVRSADAPGCSLAWFQVTPASIPSPGVQVPPHGAVTLPAHGAIGPSIQMLESGTNQDACQNSQLTLAYSGSAHS
jgi:hypothetical protein